MRGLYIGAVGVAVVLAGFGLGALTGELTSGDAATTRQRAVGVYDCPAGDRLTDYQPGSRVYVTGRSQSGNWIQVRDLDQPSARVWMQASALDLDDPDTTLPTVGCETEGFTMAATETTTTLEVTTTTVPESTTTTTEETTTTEGTPPSTEATTTTTSSTTTTTTPDNTPPTLKASAPDPNKIWEQGCTIDHSDLTAEALDSGSGIEIVEATWTINGSPGSTELTHSAGNVYSGVFGPFPQDTLAQGEDEIVDITITARDRAGNETHTEPNLIRVRVHDSNLSGCS
jgi:single-stranded DNA-binding protein